jgi:hypothetical protein
VAAATLKLAETRAPLSDKRPLKGEALAQIILSFAELFSMSAWILAVGVTA